MENNKKTTIFYGLGAIVLLVVIILMFRALKKDTTPVENIDQKSEQVAPIEETDTTGAKQPTPLSYADALVKYKNARIQLDENCQASPNDPTFKNGTSIMIDNRAPVTRTVKIGSVYTIKAYGFKIIKLSANTVPMKFLVDCDKSQNVAAILIQK